MSCILNGTINKEVNKCCEDYAGVIISQNYCGKYKHYFSTNDIDYIHKCITERNRCLTNQKELEDIDHT